MTMRALDNIRTAQRCVEEWLDFLSALKASDERFLPALRSYREAIRLRNRLEKEFASHAAD